ncbi:unnamed protein product [Psylliodes chrysocephalus]|uniref:Uncharacterized protein n=1 Tax=Psylliodes chrysocephalus TaxID=3402493 RepID=A0A9P0G4R5_9CUCU|nr:unnamed protein product [Psylliodes chrysocephala]
MLNQSPPSFGNNTLQHNVNEVTPNDIDNINNEANINDTVDNIINGDIINDNAAVIIGNQNPFENISAIPVVPGPSGCQKRKQQAKILTSPEIIAKKETKDKRQLQN